MRPIHRFRLLDAVGALHPRQQVSVLAATVTLVCGALIGSIPVPYALMRPGPVRDVLGTTTGHQGAPAMIAISGKQTYPTDGELDLLTVGISGGQGSRIRLAQAIQGWLDPTVSVRPLAELYPPELTRQQIEEQNSAAMNTSQENATAAALRELSIPIPSSMRVDSFTEQSKADGPLREDDVILTVDGKGIQDLAGLRTALAAKGVGAQVSLRVKRGGETLTVPITTVSGVEGRPALGVLVDPQYVFPFKVDISIDAVGGPSAGMMFALGIVDKLTPGAMTGGKRISGTGTMDASGAVGPIGGVRQKMVGAQRAGAQYFLAPAANCPETVGYVPAGLTVFKVATLHEARVAVETIGSGGNLDGLARCTG